MSATLDPVIAAVTERIRERSQDSRQAYLARIRADAAAPRGVARLSCANVAHALATMDAGDKAAVSAGRRPNIAIVTSYNDVLSAHRPYEHYPEVIRAHARRRGASAQVAGGTPAMCDGVTQGMPGMELSLFSRDVIAMSTAIALSHDVFDAALLLGVCDKIVPGMLMGALSIGHLPCVFVPAGPMSSGIANAKKAKAREAYVNGEISREEMLGVEQQAYHGAGTCTFYGTANSNQVLLDAMGLHVPGAAFVAPRDPRRALLTEAAVDAALDISRPGESFTPIGELVNEKSIVNAFVTLVATGGSTNHLIHFVAVAMAAGIVIDWSDIDELSSATPLLARIYPNGPADINDFEAAGGTGFILQQLLDAGLVHDDVATVAGPGLRTACRRPVMASADVARPEPESELGRAVTGARGGGPDRDACLEFIDPPRMSPDREVVRTAADPFAPSGGLALLSGNLGRSVIKVSAVAPENLVVEAPAFVAESQEDVVEAFAQGRLDHDVVVVVRGQGPQANGMPELHRLTSVLGSLQSAGHRVALVTDGRMSGASGKIPAAIHVTPEAAAGGPLACLRTGDLVRLDVPRRSLHAHLSSTTAQLGPVPTGLSMGRELFGAMRATVRGAEQGAVTWLPGQTARAASHHSSEH